MAPEIDWLEATARYLSEYYGEDLLTSLEDLTRMMGRMREIEESTWCSFRDHMLMKHIEIDEGEVWSTEWFLLRKATSLSEFPDGSPSLAYAHDDTIIGLPGVLDGE